MVTHMGMFECLLQRDEVRVRGDSCGDDTGETDSEQEEMHVLKS